MNNFAELITRRRSVRQYTDEPIAPEEVKQIMRAALLAPTSKNNRSWQFVLVEDKADLQKLSQSKPSGAAFVENCALAIVILTDNETSEAPVEDSSIAATFIQLQAEDLNLGSCWVQIKGRTATDGCDSEQYIRELLSIPNNFSVGCIVAIGHKAKDGKPQDEAKMPWERVHVGRY
jgi:nitroreductase